MFEVKYIIYLIRPSCQRKLAGDKSSFNNYRHISLLPQFSKIVEQLFNARMDAFIEKHDTLTSSQYGFISNMSTS